jgi:hypothetical protein
VAAATAAAATAAAAAAAALSTIDWANTFTMRVCAMLHFAINFVASALE